MRGSGARSQIYAYISEAGFSHPTTAKPGLENFENWYPKPNLNLRDGLVTAVTLPGSE